MSDEINRREFLLIVYRALCMIVKALQKELGIPDKK
jgi:hypothetical protein